MVLDSRRVLVGKPGTKSKGIKNTLSLLKVRFETCFGWDPQSTKPQTHVFWLGPPVTGTNVLSKTHLESIFGWDPQ